MNDFLKFLLNKSSLRSAVCELSFDQLQEIKEKFDDVIQARLEATEAAHVTKLAHEKKPAEFRRLLVSEGISAEDLFDGTSIKAPCITSSIKRHPRRARYSYILNGEENTWTGLGRMPAKMANAIEKGHKTLEDFLIPLDN